MYIKYLQLINVKSFADSGKIELSRGINILLGPNNSGKSIIINSIGALQNRNLLQAEDIRINSENGNVTVEFDDILKGYLFPMNKENFAPSGAYYPTLTLNKNIKNKNENGGVWDIKILKEKSEAESFSQFPEQEPNNFIYPYLAKRKVGNYNQVINKENTINVPINLYNLVAKIDALADITHPLHSEYMKLCLEILGFRITTFASEKGKQAGIRIGNLEGIPIESMGEGIPNMLGFIVNICVAQNKLFLIEEIENDIHPKALKSLLEVILKKVEDNNQFIISTHSNIVAKILGSLESTKIHSINLQQNKIVPTSKYEKIGEDPVKRKSILEKLGYEMFDYDLWEAWLILEESSAERIIREFLFKWFTPNLQSKLKTVASQGVEDISEKFISLDRLFLFTYLEPAYKNKVWVIADGDTVGNTVIKNLQDKYIVKGWNKDQFKNFTECNFEEYYPNRFKDKVKDVLAINKEQAKRLAKKELLEEVIKWIKGNEPEAEKEFQDSAKEVIKILKKIEKNISK